MHALKLVNVRHTFDNVIDHRLLWWNLFPVTAYLWLTLPTVGSDWLQESNKFKTSQSRSQIILILINCMLTRQNRPMTPTGFFVPLWVLLLALNGTQWQSQELLNTASIGEIVAEHHVGCQKKNSILKRPRRYATVCSSYMLGSKRMDSSNY